jgi:hypothetical protein
MTPHSHNDVIMSSQLQFLEESRLFLGNLEKLGGERSTACTSSFVCPAPFIPVCLIPPGTKFAGHSIDVSRRRGIAFIACRRKTVGTVFSRIAATISPDAVLSAIEHTAGRGAVVSKTDQSSLWSGPDLSLRRRGPAIEIPHSILRERRIPQRFGRARQSRASL